MFKSADIHTLTEFNRKPSEHIKRLSETKRPEMLTVNGKPALVVQDAESYERMAELAEYAEALQTLKQAHAEEGRPFKEFQKEFEAKHGL